MLWVGAVVDHYFSIVRKSDNRKLLHPKTLQATEIQMEPELIGSKISESPKNLSQKCNFNEVTQTAHKVDRIPVPGNNDFRVTGEWKFGWRKAWVKSSSGPPFPSLMTPLATDLRERERFNDLGIRSSDLLCLCHTSYLRLLQVLWKQSWQGSRTRVWMHKVAIPFQNSRRSLPARNLAFAHTAKELEQNDNICTNCDQKTGSNIWFVIGLLEAIGYIKAHAPPLSFPSVSYHVHFLPLSNPHRYFFLFKLGADDN